MFYLDVIDWTTIATRAEYEKRFPDMPARIIDNLLEPKAKISVIPWKKVIADPDAFRWLIDVAFRNRVKCEYDHSRPL